MDGEADPWPWVAGGEGGVEEAAGGGGGEEGGGGGGWCGRTGVVAWGRGRPPDPGVFCLPRDARGRVVEGSWVCLPAEGERGRCDGVNVVTEGLVWREK